jgi:hypothetical protein
MGNGDPLVSLAELAARAAKGRIKSRGSSFKLGRKELSGRFSYNKHEWMG